MAINATDGDSPCAKYFNSGKEDMKNKDSCIGKIITCVNRYNQSDKSKQG